MGLTWEGIFVGFGIVWLPLALILLTEPEGRRAPWRVLLGCAVGWLATFAVFAGIGALGG